jgi:hypothetical protein
MCVKKLTHFILGGGSINLSVVLAQGVYCNTIQLAAITTHEEKNLLLLVPQAIIAFTFIE